MLRVDPPSFLLAIGTLYTAMPVTVWILLNHRHPRLNVNLWCLSGLLFSLMALLLGLRGQVSDLVTVHGANAVGYLVLKAGVLRIESGRRPAWLPLLAAAAAATALTALAHAIDTALRVATINLLLAAGLLLQTVLSLQLARVRGSRSARLMALLFGLFAAALAGRGVQHLAVVGRPVDALGPDPVFVVTLLLSLLAGIGANIGYMGLALDRARANAREQRTALDALRENQQTLQLASRTREAVAIERARTTRLLAHEVRQPLHNAAVALQSGAATLASSRDPAEAARAIEQAQAVIRRVSATLDNTVAATTMLTADERISTADTDLQMLLDLCLGDLPPDARSRVQIDYRADARSARLEPSLLRLALRNLLVNATLYAPGDSPVTLRVLDSDEPLALVLEVADLGPGIPEDLRERIFDEGTRGPQPTVPGYGLGLHVVKRVARLHGGSITWQANRPQGSVFRLVLPQGDPA
jgi:signal transduction histidine kinase